MNNNFSSINSDERLEEVGIKSLIKVSYSEEQYRESTRVTDNCQPRREIMDSRYDATSASESSRQRLNFVIATWMADV